MRQLFQKGAMVRFFLAAALLLFALPAQAQFIYRPILPVPIVAPIPVPVIVPAPLPVPVLPPGTLYQPHPVLRPRLWFQVPPVKADT